MWWRPASPPLMPLTAHSVQPRPWGCTSKTTLAQNFYSKFQAFLPWYLHTKLLLIITCRFSLPDPNVYRTTTRERTFEKKKFNEFKRRSFYDMQVLLWFCFKHAFRDWQMPSSAEHGGRADQIPWRSYPGRPMPCPLHAGHAPELLRQKLIMLPVSPWFVYVNKVSNVFSLVLCFILFDNTCIANAW